MNDIEYVKKFAPDLIEKLIFRFKILEYISINAPVGRRNIASHLGVGERIVRNELEFFTDEKFIEVIKSGTFITELGESILQELRGLVNNLNENHIIAEELKNKVVDKAKELKDVIAISGGTTVKSFVDTMSVKKYYNEISVIPARGSLGNGLECQSNVVANNLSKKLKAKFFGTFLPDYLDELTFDRLKDLEEVKTLIEYLDKINVLIFGIGRAYAMEKIRSLKSY